MLTSFDTQVQNIKCSGCVNTIEKNIGAMPGVQHVSVSQATGMVSITGVGLNTTEIKEKLASLGYPPKEKNNLFKKMKTSIQCAFKQ
jgi:copper chaperone CopZ